jgi:hypothetical protein
VAIVINYYDRIIYYDRQGQPMDRMDWVVKFEDRDYKTVEQTEIGEAFVSTVWMGIDHNFGEGSPLIFETMIFGGDHDGCQWRWATEDDARIGHRLTVEKLRES